MSSEVKEESNSASSDVKNEESSEETKKIDNEVKDEQKDSEKSESKEENKKDASEDEDEESEDEEVALLDRPVEVSGCRARKKVERLDVSFSAPPKDKQEIPEGKGKKLGDCPRIEVQIQKMKVLDLKPMHKILFNRTGSANEIKKNIRKFSGFPFEKDSQEFTRKKASLEKMTTALLKQVCLILDIERSGTKEEIVSRILTFLLNPEDSGKKVPAPKKKASKEKKKASEKKKVKSEKKGKSSKDSKESDGDAEESAEEDDDSTGGEASMGGTDEEAEGTLEPKKKSKETKSKAKAEKAKKEDKKQKATKRKRDDDEEEDDDKKSSGSSDDEPVAKKSKMPSDEEISKLVKKILESADLQEITMKKVIKQVSDTYPDFDLSHKKAFIKSTIKAIL